ncbi:MAG: NUDIX domain-containing protein [archaeon]
MELRIRAAAIIIKDGKMLMVRVEGYPDIWTPGGKLEKGESDLDALKRELDEEIGVELVSAEFFGEYIGKSPYHDDVLTKNRMYLAEISGEVKPGARHEVFWVSREDFESKKYPIIYITAEQTIPDLIKKGIF